MTWTKILALSFVMVACTERVVEAITGRGDPPGDRARRKPTQPAPARTERQELADAIRQAVADVRAQRTKTPQTTFTTTVGATS